MEPSNLSNLMVRDMRTLSNLTPAEAERIGRYARRSREAGTYKMWEMWWRIVACVCSQMGAALLPMEWETAAAILTRMADVGYAYKSISNVRGVIAVAHKLNDLADPTRDRRFRRVFSGIARVIGTDCPNRKDPVLMCDLRKMMSVAAKSGTMKAFQEWTILLLGFFGAFRRGEIVALDVENVRFLADGTVDVIITRSKMEQTRSRIVNIGPLTDESLCPVRTLRAWLEMLGQERGPLFRTVTHLGVLSKVRMCDRTVNRIVKRYCTDIGYDARRFGGHSLRVGFVTQGIANGVPDLQLAQQTRQSDLRTLLGYHRPRRGVGRNLSQAMLDA